MKLITKELDAKLEKQRKMFLADEKGMKAVAHFFHPLCNIDWYLIAYSMDDLANKDYIFSLTKGDFVEFGDIYLPEIEAIKVAGLSIERDRWFDPIDAQELYEKLKEQQR